MRDRLNNRNQGGGSRHRPKDNRNRGDHKRGDSRRGPPHSGGLAQGASRSSHKDGGADSRDRDERDLRLQRMMTATQTKGQLISKCPYEKSVSSKIPTKIFLEFCPEIFCSFLGAAWKLFGIPGDLVSNTISKQGRLLEAQKATRKPPESYKRFQGRNPEIFSLVIWMKVSIHKEIMKLTNL